MLLLSYTIEIITKTLHPHSEWYQEASQNEARGGSPFESRRLRRRFTGMQISSFGVVNTTQANRPTGSYFYFAAGLDINP
jgi:hypothetical protein